MESVACLVEGEIIQESGQVQKEIKTFWGDLLGRIRPFNEDKLCSLIRDHPKRFPEQEKH